MLNSLGFDSYKVHSKVYSLWANLYNTLCYPVIIHMKVIH